MTWNVTTTVLTSVFSGILVVVFLYGIHAYIMPHLKQPKDTPDFTLPQHQRLGNHRLRESLYSLSSLNYIDPRNSIADTELRSSRWSTNLQDLSYPASPIPSRLPGSPSMPFQSHPDRSINSPSHERGASAISNINGTTDNKHRLQRNAARPALSKKENRRDRSQTLDLSINTGISNGHFSRSRSAPDLLVLNGRGLLARSHAALYGLHDMVSVCSPTTSSFSGTTVLPSPGPQEADIKELGLFSELGNGTKMG